MDSYNSFAEYYDALMEDARYEERCRFILDAAERFGHPMGRTLDLACGTGTLTLLLRQHGVDVFGCDGSVEMLSEAMQKSLEAQGSDVQRTFDAVSRAMNPGGLFLFDVNTVYKHRSVLADNVFVTENERVFCVWQNFPRENDTTDIALDFFAEEDGVYYRSSEDFSERAYPEEQLRDMLARAGFDVLAVCGDLRFEPPAEDEQRAIYIARKES